MYVMCAVGAKLLVILSKMLMILYQWPIFELPPLNLLNFKLTVGSCITHTVSITVWGSFELTMSSHTYYSHGEDHSMRIRWTHNELTLYSHGEDHSMRIIWTHNELTYYSHGEDHSMSIIWTHNELTYYSHGEDHSMRIVWCHCDHRMISRVDWVSFYVVITWATML